MISTYLIVTAHQRDQNQPSLSLWTAESERATFGVPEPDSSRSLNKSQGKLPFFRTVVDSKRYIYGLQQDMISSELVQKVFCLHVSPEAILSAWDSGDAMTIQDHPRPICMAPGLAPLWGRWECQDAVPGSQFHGFISKSPWSRWVVDPDGLRKATTTSSFIVWRFWDKLTLGFVTWNWAKEPLVISKEKGHFKRKLKCFWGIQFPDRLK